MPLVKLKHIVSLSSEDKVFKAENLLQANQGKKWTCATPGEAQASVVIQLEKATTFSGIDIGNDGSAFVEILVSRSTGEESYKVLLVASSFMNLSESRSGTNVNRVRMFDLSKLSPEVANEKWDRVKIVCTQPFNKHTAYGLRFITFHSPEEKDNSGSSVFTNKQPSTAEGASGDQPRTSFGAFKLKANLPDKPTTVPSSFRKTATPQMVKTEPSPINIEKLKRKAATASVKSTPEKRKKSDDVRSTNKSSVVQKNPTSSAALNPQQSASSSSSTTSRRKLEKTKPDKKEKTTTKGKKKQFCDLLNDVVFVLSGYQNPERGEIRDKALMMGAQYKRDWGQDCTHLVCAFVNTPKYHQVIGTEGRIVKAEWITDCYDEKRRLPIKVYNLRPDYISADEVKIESDDNDDATNPYDDSTDEESPDTEDEIQRIFKKRSKEEKTSPQGGDRDVYEESTDEETEEENTDDELKSLPDYFNGIDFFLYGQFQGGVERLLKRHILACDGTIANYMSDDVKYVLTESSWQKDFDDALGDNPNLVFVKPLWVFRCGQEKKLIPHQPFAVPVE